MIPCSPAASRSPLGEGKRKRTVRRPPDPTSATIVSLLAYEGLRPEELLALDVERHVGPGGLSVRRKVVSHREPGGRWVAEVLPYTKTRRNRVVKWTAPQVRRDVRDYCMATGIRRGLLFPKGGDPAAPWIKHDWDNWREDVYQPAARAVGIADPRPYDLRASFVSLLAWEGYTMLEVAPSAGHSVQTCDKHYAKVFEDVDPEHRVKPSRRSPPPASPVSPASPASSTSEPATDGQRSRDPGRGRRVHAEGLPDVRCAVHDR